MSDKSRYQANGWRGTVASRHKSGFIIKWDGQNTCLSKVPKCQSPRRIKKYIPNAQRPLTVAVESRRTPLERAAPTAEVPCDKGGRLGWSGIFSISFFASSQTSRF